MMTRTILRRALGSALCALTLTACGSAAVSGPGNDLPESAPPVGTYSLYRADGHALPYEYDQKPSGGDMIRATWVSGKITYRADGTFAMSLVRKTTGPGYSGLPATQSYTGTWEVEGGGVRMHASSGTALYTSSDGLATLSVNATYTRLAGGSASMVLVFRR